MHEFAYPARFTPENDGAFTVTFRDVPEAITSGSNLADAAEQAADCLQEAIAGRLVRREEIPTPSMPRRGERLVPVALYLAPKLALYLTMKKMGVSNVALARKLGLTELVIRRMLTPKHATKPEKIQAALEALGKTLVVGMKDAA